MNSTYPLRKVEILLVEDNPGDIVLIEEAFKEASVPYNLNVVKNGEDAIFYLRHEESFSETKLPDLILLDLNLPKKSGKEVLSEIKSDKDLKIIPVIILTTSKNYQDILCSYSLNANCYLVKPVEFEEFLDTVKSIDKFWLTKVNLPTMID